MSKGPQGFFPHRQALGLRVGEDLSPALVEQVHLAGNTAAVVPRRHEALGVLSRVAISRKRVERQTERIGEERVAQREAEIEAWLRLPLVQLDQAPAGARPAT